MDENNKVQIGDILTGQVKKIVSFGAIVRLDNGQYGLVHISQISKEYVQQISDFVKAGDRVKVIVTQIAKDGRIDLSMKQLKNKQEKKQPLEQNDSLKFSPFDKLEKVLDQDNK